MTFCSPTRPSLFLRLTFYWNSPEAASIEAAISDRRQGDRNSRFSAFNPTQNTRLTGAGISVSLAN
jgi:hypothetical protein